MRTFAREPALGLTTLVLVGLMAMFIVFPMVQVALVPGGEKYAEFFGENGPNWIKVTQNSLWVTVRGTATAVLLGFAFAYAMVYSRMPWKPFFRLIAILPMLSPPFVVSFSYIMLFGPRGLISYGLFGQSPTILGLDGLWGVQTIAFFPYAYQLIADVLARSDPRLEQASRNLGAGPWQVFRTVTLPLSRPGLVGATLLVAIYILEDFGNPAVIAGKDNVLPTLAYGEISGLGNLEFGAVASIILLVLAMVLYVVRLRLEGKRGYVTVSGRGSAIPRPPVPWVVSAASFVLCLLLSGVILIVYGVLLVSALVEAFPYNPSFTLKHFEYIGAHSTALRNSLTYAGIAALLCTLFAVLLAYLVQRREWPGRGAVDFLAIAPAAVPGIFFGIGYATTFNQRWLDWIDRGALITIALLFWNIPVAYRASVAGLQQIDRSIDEAATSLGASSLRSFRDVLFPLLRGPVTTGFVTAFVRAITTLSLVIFLFTPSTTLTTIVIFQLVNDFNWGGATAYTVSVIGIAIAVLTTVWFISGRQVHIGQIAEAAAPAGPVVK